MTADHNQSSPFANGPAENDAAEGGADSTARSTARSGAGSTGGSTHHAPFQRDPSAPPIKPKMVPGPDLGPGIPVPSRFGESLSTILPIPTTMGRALPANNPPSAWPVPGSVSFIADVVPEAAAVAEPDAEPEPDAVAVAVADAVPESDTVAAELPAPATVDPYADESMYEDTFYGQIGGHATFEKMIHVFYEGIAADPLLRAMYAEEDLGPAERRMLMFMEQYWGGPRTYLKERGHPRLRMRHVAFELTPEARDRWLAAMRKGVDAVELAPLHEATLWDYLERAAASLVNAPSDPSQRA